MSGVPTVNADLAERVRRVAEDMAYRPSEAARGLALGAIRNIGALMPDLGNAYFHDVLKSMNDVASPTGYRMLIADHSGDPDSEFATAWDLLGYVRPGLALLSLRLDVARLRELRAAEHPHRVGEPRRHRGRPTDGRRLGFTAMLEICAHLAELGHRKVVYLSGSELAWQDRERWRAVQTSSRFLGIEASRVESDGTIETSYHQAEAARAIGPTALICFNDLAAIGAISKLRELGLHVPRDISVTGFDDIAIGRHTVPALTTASSPRYELGRQAWHLLHDALQDRRPTENATLLPATLITRASTGPAPND